MRKPKAIKGSHPIIAKLIAEVMEDGKKSQARKTVFHALALLKKWLPGVNPATAVRLAVRSRMKPVELGSRAVDGKTQQVPVQVGPEVQRARAMRAILKEAHSRKGRSMAERLAGALASAYLASRPDPESTSVASRSKIIR